MRPETLPAESPQPTRLADYTSPNFKIDSVELDFDLKPKATRVKSKLALSRVSGGDFHLDGEDILLKSVTLDGNALKRDDYTLTQTELVLKDLPDE